jgi:sentrin-specific protease 7
LILRRTTVDKEDIPRLDEGQCLNDNLIGYGLRYLFDVFSGRTKDLHDRVYLHNSFFYEKLKAGRAAINYDGVKNWTAKVDLLSYDYIIVPVNEHYHWWVAIICNPGKLDPASKRDSGDTRDPGQSIEGKVNGASSDVEMPDVTEKRPVGSPRDKIEIVKSDLVDLVSDDKNASIDLTSTSRAKQTKKSKPGARTYNPDDPRIITLDSLGSTHPQAISHLKKYLFAEFEHKRNTVITESSTPLGMRAINIPEQDNLCDCGVYLLGYIQEFVKDPDQFIRTLLRKESPDWEFDPSDLRKLWRDTIFNERRLHLKPQREPKGKLEGSAVASTPKSSVEPSRHPSRDNTTEETNTSNGKLGNDTNSEHLAHTSISGSPMNVDTPLVDGHSTEPTPYTTQPTRTSGSDQPQVSGMVRSPPPPQPPVVQQDDSEEAMVPIPTVEGDPVLPTVEAPDAAEELPGPPTQPRDDPQFLFPLPSTPPSGPGEDEETPVEIPPTSFHSPNAAKSRTRQGRSVPSSPTSVRRRRAAKNRPKHTTSHFVVDDGSPVVERAEVVRNSDPIDLTDD